MSDFQNWFSILQLRFA